MGSTAWSDDHYRERERYRKQSGRSAFAYDHDVKQGRVAAQVHDRMNPNGVRVRESRDSESHPTSHAVGVLMDVTGSMGQVPIILQANLPKLMGLLIRKNYLEHPQILIGGIGDATCDRAPLQVGQFESGIEIEDDLSRLFIEGGGGGHITESYELAMYFMARHTSIDCHEKRGKRGYLFIIGDELPYPKVKRKEVAKVMGDDLARDLPTEDLVQELKSVYDVYFILPRLTSHYDDKTIFDGWTKLLGQNVLKLEDPAGICEMIAGAVGVAEGVMDPERVTDDLVEIGSDRRIAAAIGKALAPMSRHRRQDGPLQSGSQANPADGLARF